MLPFKGNKTAQKSVIFSFSLHGVFGYVKTMGTH